MMKKLNQHSTKIFCALLLQLGEKEYWQKQIDNFLPLTLERVGEGIKTPFGTATFYSLMHHFIQNGDLMRDPEMNFLVIDNRQQQDDYAMIDIYPQSYQLDSLGVYEESIKIKNKETIGYLFRYQAAHCNLANLWLSNIKAQGFLT